jgi:riboflavin kinase/FMN adenylyltransferase
MTALGQRYGFSVEVIEDQAAEPERSGDARPDDVDAPGDREPGDDDDTAAPRAQPAQRARLRQVAEPLHRRWSSTWTRELLAAGKVAEAAQVLGRPHRMRGVVVRGDARGRELGYPTANLSADSTGMVPADGVYAGWLRVTRRPGEPERAATVAAGEVEPARWPAAISVGTNPTFDGVERRVEAYVLDRDDLNLYDCEVVVEFVARLRPTVRFQSVDELITTMDEDVRRARSALARAAAAVPAW